MWALIDLKNSLEMLSPAPKDDQAAADALNNQTQPAPILPVSVGAILGIVLMAPSGDWDRLSARAAAPKTGGTGDVLISLANRAIVLLTGSKQVDTVDAVHWPSFASMLGTLVAAGDISSATQNAITALAQPSATVPRWQPMLTVGDIQTARGQQ